MRLDKFLKVSRLVKRRTVANEICAAGRVAINDKVAKPGSTVQVGDEITIAFGSGLSRVKVSKIQQTARKEDAAQMYELISSDKDN